MHSSDSLSLSSGSHLPRLLSNPPLISCSILLKHGESFALCRIVRVWIVKQILNTQQDLLDCNSRFPTLIFVEDGETNGARGEDVRMEERWGEFALGWFARVFFREDHAEFVETTFPWCLFRRGWSGLSGRGIERVRKMMQSKREMGREGRCGDAYVGFAGNADFPVHKVERAIRCLCWSCVEALRGSKWSPI